MALIISTERLILREYSEVDLCNIHKLRSEPLVWRFSSKETISDINESKMYLDSILKNYADNKPDFEALLLKGTHEYIGEAGILSFNSRNKRAALGYNLLPEYWGKGYATEITKALVKYLFEDIEAERIEALVIAGNEASKKVLEKTGFVEEGLLRNFTYINDSYHNVHYYGMIKSDYMAI